MGNHPLIYIYIYETPTASALGYYSLKKTSVNMKFGNAINDNMILTKNIY